MSFSILSFLHFSLTFNSLTVTVAGVKSRVILIGIVKMCSLKVVTIKKLKESINTF